MVNILPAAPHGTTDQMSPDHAAVPALPGRAFAGRLPRVRGTGISCVDSDLGAPHCGTGRDRGGRGPDPRRAPPSGTRTSGRRPTGRATDRSCNKCRHQHSGATRPSRSGQPSRGLRDQAGHSPAPGPASEPCARTRPSNPRSGPASRAGDRSAGVSGEAGLGRRGGGASGHARLLWDTSADLERHSPASSRSPACGQRRSRLSRRAPATAFTSIGSRPHLEVVEPLRRDGPSQ